MTLKPFSRCPRYSSLTTAIAWLPIRQVIRRASATRHFAPSAAGFASLHPPYTRRQVGEHLSGKAQAADDGAPADFLRQVARVDRWYLAAGSTWGCRSRYLSAEEPAHDPARQRQAARSFLACPETHHAGNEIMRRGK